MADTANEQATTSEAAGKLPVSEQGWYRWYALGLLFVVYIFNFIDRSILGILNQSIKEELGVSDTEMGFLGGIAFAIFYTFVGIPIARLADRKSRRNILAICLAIWSLMTAACGLVQNFVQLLFARIGVAVGEAGGSPPSHSMISDFFATKQRATALGIYALGIPVGTMIGNLAGGFLNEELSWRMAFIVVGLPGVLLAVFVRFFLVEPRRGAAEEPKAVEPEPGPASEDAEEEPPPVMEVFKYLWSRKSFRYMSLGAALHAFVGYGVGYWIPAFFERSHGLTSSQIGLALFYLGFAGMAGTFLGGYMADKLAVRDIRWYVWLPGIATLVSVPFAAYTYMASDPWLGFWVYSVVYLLGAYYLGPTFSLTQSLVGIRMRALAASILLFILNLIGMGLGPQITGILSDIFNAMGYGTDSLRWALVIVLVANVASTVLYLMAARTLKSDLDRVGET